MSTLKFISHATQHFNTKGAFARGKQVTESQFILDRGYLEAIERINECNWRNGTSLDLSELGLIELPSEIGQLTKLESLDLTGNSLSDLPTELCNLKILRSLDLMENS